jgi:branched-chain amino acid transport system ATP-binding protein
MSLKRKVAILGATGAVGQFHFLGRDDHVDHGVGETLLQAHVQQVRRSLPPMKVHVLPADDLDWTTEPAALILRLVFPRDPEKVVGIEIPESIFRGEDITSSPPHHRARHGISLVPEGRRIFPDLTVGENLLMGAYIQDDRKEVQSSMEEAFDLFPVLKERKNQIGKTLSGGEQQMLAIGRTLMCELKLLLLDEPSAGLAPLLVKNLFEILNKLREEFSLTILLVEQNAEAALRFANRGLVIAQGQIMLDGEAEL